jgi:hypothetical protein
LKDRRWSVDFGLDLNRSLLAVPYKAKGVPHPSSEFSHTDITILLTCTSYYYSGLTEDQLLISFKTLLRESNATEEYEIWCVSAGNLPQNLRSVNSININDQATFIVRFYDHFRLNKKTIDFFLRKEVFPKHATEYTERMCASGWDIPSTNEERLTIGFSGTNDNRSLLPLTINQEDVPDQQHTNAMVLDLLLRAENQEYFCAVGENNVALSTHGLLKHLAARNPPVHVLVDVGAQILDLSNQAVAKTWLALVPTAVGCLYFDEDHVPIVLDQLGRSCPLHHCPLIRKMEKMLIFLDECHTRGIDLPIPAGIRALVTLGPRLTKDRLAQGMTQTYNTIELIMN